MPSFGGYGKALGLYLVAALAPLIGGEFLAFIYTEYFLWFFIGGIVIMVLAMLGIQSYGVTSSRGIRKIAADMQFPDGTQDFMPILYKEPIKDLGSNAEKIAVNSSMLQNYAQPLPEGRPADPPSDPKAQTTVELEVRRHRYAITDLEGNDWLVMLDHPLPQIVPTMDDTPMGTLIATISTQKGTFLPLRYIDEPLAESEIDYPGFFDRHILRREAKTHREVREIYGISTAAKVKAYKDALIKDFQISNSRAPSPAEEQELTKKLTAMGYSVVPPSYKEIKSMYDDWVDYRYNEAKTELEQEKAHSKDYQEMLDDHLPITLETAPSQINEGTTDWATFAKYILIAGIVAVVALVVTKLLKLW